MERVWVGVDWGETKHAYVTEPPDGTRERGEFVAAPESVEWARAMRDRYPEQTIVIALEQSRGALIYALEQYDCFELVPVNPRAASAYRQSLYLSGAKDDPIDAELLCRFVGKHYAQLRKWRPDEVVTRKLRLLVEGRRVLVEQRTAITQALTATLKAYFPQVLSWFESADHKLARAFLTLWPTVKAVQAARRDAIVRLVRAHSRMSPERLDGLISAIRSATPLTTDEAIIAPSSLLATSYVGLLDQLHRSITAYDQQIAAVWADHPDRELFASFPGAGAVMAPRLATAFGQDRTRFADAAQIQTYSGIAPVIERSGKQSWTHARWQCPKFLKQTFHEFAAASLPFSPWALAHYRQQRERGAGHHAAVRSVAFRWIRILFHCWATRTSYDEQHHIEQLRRRGSPLVERLKAA
jgi:transposase